MRHEPTGGGGDPSRAARGLTLVEVLIAVAVLGVLVAIAIPQFVGYRERADTRKAIADLHTIEMGIDSFRREFGRLPLSLADAVDPVPKDPWGNPYRYLNLEAGLPDTAGKRRRDMNMNPINSDYDLYSMGPDGETQAQLVATKARDDIVRAADGDFVGVAEDF